MPANLPRSLAAWLPFLWSRVLFPGGACSGVERCRLSSLLVLLLVPAALLYPCLSFHLFEPDESRYAEIPREMLQRGEWVVPYLQGEPYLDKPPLLYWLIEASYAVFGVKVWAARLVPALAVHGCILLVYLLGRRSLGERAAFWGALGLGLAPGFLSMGRLLLMDSLLTLWTTLALLSAFESVRGGRLRWGWWLLASLACGLGVLTKGPVALVLLLPPLALQRWLTGTTCRVGRAGAFVFVLVLAAVTLPWYAAMTMRVPAFAGDFLWEHNVRRFLAPFAHEHGLWFYGPVLLAGLLPGTLLLLPFLRFLLSSAPDRAGRRTAELSFVLLAGGWCVFFFTLSQCKLPTYIMPAFPLLALALGHFLVHSRWQASRLPRITAAVTFTVLAAVHHLACPWYAAYRSPVGRPEEVRRLCADPTITVVCYPRNCDSAAFYLGRDDLRSYRSKSIEELRTLVRVRPRTVILCTHRHSLGGLRQLLPPDVRIVDEAHFGLRDIRGVPPRLMKVLVQLMGETALGLCDIAVVEPGWRHPALSQQANVPISDPKNRHDDDEADEGPDRVAGHGRQRRQTPARFLMVVLRLVGEDRVQRTGFLGDGDHVLKIQRKQAATDQRGRQFLAAPQVHLDRLAPCREGPVAARLQAQAHGLDDRHAGLGRQAQRHAKPRQGQRAKTGTDPRQAEQERVQRGALAETAPHQRIAPASPHRKPNTMPRKIIAPDAPAKPMPNGSSGLAPGTCESAIIPMMKISPASTKMASTNWRIGQVLAATNCRQSVRWRA